MVSILVVTVSICGFVLSQGKKSKVSTIRQTQVATSTLSKAAFLLMVLSERLELHNLAFSTGMFSLELQRPPASTKALEVSRHAPFLWTRPLPCGPAPSPLISLSTHLHAHKHAHIHTQL